MWKNHLIMTAAMVGSHMLIRDVLINSLVDNHTESMTEQI